MSFTNRYNTDNTEPSFSFSSCSLFGETLKMLLACALGFLLLRNPHSMGQVQSRLAYTHTHAHTGAHRIRCQMTLPFVRGSGFCRGREGWGGGRGGGREGKRQESRSLESSLMKLFKSARRLSD